MLLRLQTVIEMRQLCEQHHPDVLVMDISMPGPSFIDRVAFVKALEADIKLLVLTAFEDTVYIQAMFKAGVEGYVLKRRGQRDAADRLTRRRRVAAPTSAAGC